MSGSEQHDRVALVSVDDQAIIGGIIHRNLLETDGRERQTSLEEAQEVLRRRADGTEYAATVQSVCDHPAQIIASQKQIMDLQSQRFLSPQCDNSTFEQLLKALRQELEEARRTPRVAGMDREL